MFSAGEVLTNVFGTAFAVFQRVGLEPNQSNFAPTTGTTKSRYRPIQHTRDTASYILGVYAHIGRLVEGSSGVVEVTGLTTVPRKNVLFLLPHQFTVY